MAKKRFKLPDKLKVIIVLCGYDLKHIQEMVRFINEETSYKCNFNYKECQNQLDTTCICQSCKKLYSVLYNESCI